MEESKMISEDVKEETMTAAQALEKKLEDMRKAQKVFATFTQDQVDKIFFEASMAANKARIPLAKMACEETGMMRYLKTSFRQLHS